MILFWVLFLLIILISFSLAYLSMKDFQTSPEDFSTQNGLFLIRKPERLTPKVMSFLYEATKGKGLILTLERLFKGSQSALVIYGPKSVLEGLIPTLDMIELEEYSAPIKSESDGEIEVSAWEIGIRKKFSKESLFLNFPKLESREQIWYQMVLQAQKGSTQFNAQVRVVIVSQDLKRRENLFNALMSKSSLVKIPKPYSSIQMLDFYKKRSYLGAIHFKLTGEQIINLWGLPQSA